jgi:thiosulfate/3-mercaptopyruvate sulfurtransferase
MRSSTVVSTEQLAQHLDDTEWIVFDCRFTLTNTEAGLHAYQLSHIPGARYAHLETDLSGPVTEKSGRHPLPEVSALSEKLSRWGVDGNKQIIVYDDSFGAMAVKMWWLLRWLGHKNVALLDGGLPKWLKEKRAVTAELPQIFQTKFIAKLNDEILANVAEVDNARQERCRLLIDARPEQRFTGEREPLDKLAGHIPGAINWVFDENLDFDGTYLPAEELREAYLKLLNGVKPEQVIHTCGSGVTACHNMLAMEIAGMCGGKLYAGSWSEWITDPARPLAKGEGHEYRKHLTDDLSSCG